LAQYGAPSRAGIDKHSRLMLPELSAYAGDECQGNAGERVLATRVDAGEHEVRRQGQTESAVLVVLVMVVEMFV
jgi:hypothetical protein